jgi:hypothetical protein
VLRWREIRRQPPLRFDVWAAPDEPDAVDAYEAYAERAAFNAHKAAEPFKKFVDEIIPHGIEPVTFVLPVGDSTVSIADLRSEQLPMHAPAGGS